MLIISIRIRRINTPVSSMPLSFSHFAALCRWLFPEQREGLQKLQLIPLHSDTNTPKTLASIRFPQTFLSQPTAAIRNSRREQECQATIHG